MDPAGRVSRVHILSILALVILCGSVLGLSNYSGHPDMRSGEMGTTSEGLRVAIASYDLSQGEKIHYEWDSNYLVRFVITTDPYHLQLSEFVNFTGTEGEGSFISPSSAKYYAQVTFVEVPAGSEARIDYEIHLVTAFSESMVRGKPLILGAMTAFLAGLLLWHRNNSRVKNEADVSGVSWTFWRFFAADYKNWIAIVVGAAMLTFYSVLALANSNHLDQSYSIEMLSYVGTGLVAWGLIFGLWISHSNYKASRRK
jgi:hypothetical protein